MRCIEQDRGELSDLRERVAAEAVGLAQPRLWTDTIGALATNLWRGASSFGADAPLLLLGAASGATGVRIGPPGLDAAAIKSAQRLVARGGPAYIKLGQLIASADGILPAPWVKAFGWCRDDAPRISARRIRSIIAREIGSGAIAELDPTPLAAGSIAQVHRAVLADGRRVVVKVRRPGLQRQLRTQIGALALAAAAAERMGDEVAAANLPGFVELFAQLALEESDFRLEAVNLEDCAAAFRACEMDWITVPSPIDGLITERVLVMEEVLGVPYDRAAATLGDSLDGARLLSLAVGGVLKSALLHGIFHGDLHAGNVLLQPDGTFGLIDFGICGRFTTPQRRSIARYLAGFAQGDAHAQVCALRDFGAMPAVSDALVSELAGELDRLARRTDGAVTFGQLGDAVSNQLSILTRHGFRMPKELVLFFKNLLYLASFAVAVAPQADLFATIESAFGNINEQHVDELAQLLAVD